MLWNTLPVILTVRRSATTVSKAFPKMKFLSDTRIIPTATKNLRRIWAFPSVLLLSIAMVFSVQLSIQQINGSSIYQYLWSWTVNNDFSLEFGYLIDPLTSIMLILITTVGILVLIYSDGYMSHDEGYLRFFVYISFFNTSNLIFI